MQKKNGEREEKSDRKERGQIRRKRYTKQEQNILLNIFSCYLQRIINNSTNIG